MSRKHKSKGASLGNRSQILYVLNEVIDNSWICSHRTVAVSYSRDILKRKLEHTALALNSQILPHAQPSVTILNEDSPEEYEYQWVLNDGDGDYLAYTITRAPLLEACEPIPDFEKQWKEHTKNGLQNPETDLPKA